MRRAAAVLLLVAVACRTAAPTASSTRRPNVLLVTVDSLRADRFDLSPGGRTPHLAALAAAGTRFSRAYTVTPWTAPALVSIFTGLYPPTHGVVNRDDTTPKTLATLPRLLAAHGYTLANFGFFTGVSYYRNLGLPAQAVVGAEISGSSALEGWLEKAPEPFFAWIHYVEPHLPYGASGYEAASATVSGGSALTRAQVSATVPRNAGLSFEPGEAEIVRRLYDEDVSRMDRGLGGVLAALAARGLDERTLVVFTADHGEELLDHGWVGHASTSGEATLNEEVLRIPLILRGPGVPRGLATDQLAQNVDVTPTTLRLLGLPAPKSLQGLALLGGRTAPRKRRLFFDTSPGGHLTPLERRAERLQGVFDGTDLHAERVGAPRRVDDPSAPRLLPDLLAWRRAQGKARLRLVASHGDLKPPAPAEVAAYAETLVVAEPTADTALGFREAGGTIRLRFEPPAPAPGAKADPLWWIEYEVGSGLLSAKGAFPVDDGTVSFGPFPVAFWNDLASYSPFRFRVLDPRTKTRSPWRRFTLARSSG